MHDEEFRNYISKQGIIKLTFLENKLLSILIQNKGRIVSYSKICWYVYNSIEISKCYLKIYRLVLRLRKKVFDELDIVNVSGYGYCIFFKGGKDEC